MWSLDHGSRGQAPVLLDGWVVLGVERERAAERSASQVAPLPPPWWRADPWPPTTAKPSNAELIASLQAFTVAVGLFGLAGVSKALTTAS